MAASEATNIWDCIYIQCGLHTILTISLQFGNVMRSRPRYVSLVTSNTVAMLGVVGEAELTNHLTDTSNTRY